MAKAKKPASGAKKPPGPPPDHLKLEGDWEDAVKQALSKKPPRDNPPELTKKSPGK